MSFKRQLKEKFNNLQREDKVYIIPTKNGLKYIFFNFSLFLIALTYSNNMSLLICFMMFSYLIFEMLRTHQLIGQLKVQSMNIDSAQFSNDKQTISFNLQNNTYGLTEANIKCALIENKQRRIESRCISINKTHITFQFRNQERGKYNISKIQISNIASLDLFFVWKRFNRNSTIYVYPEKTAPTKDEMSSREYTLFNPIDREYHTSMPYYKGASAKFIDWKKYAKTDHLKVKVYKEVTNEIVTLDYLDFNGTKEIRLKKICYLLCKLNINNVPVKLVLESKIIPPSLGPKHRQSCLEALSEF